MVAMYGPAFNASGDIVNRLVSQGDVQAYRAAGYEVGSVAEKVVEIETHPVTIHNLEDKPKTKRK